MPPSEISGTPLFASASATVATADARDDARGADRAGPDADLDRVDPGVDQRLRRLCRDDVAGNQLQLRMGRADPLDGRDHAARVAVRGVDDDDIDARLRERSDAVQRVRRGADSRTDPEAPVLVLAGTREVARLLDVLDGDHAAQPPPGVHHQHLLDPVAMQEQQHFLARRVLAHRDELLARSHDLRHRQVELLLEADVAVRDDADDLVAVGRDRQARNALGARESDDFADRRVGPHGDRVLDDSALVFLHAPDLACLVGGGHALVDDADAAFLGDGDRKPCLGDGVHRRGHERQVEPDAAGQARREVDLARKHVRVRGYEQDVVEGECFLDDAHGRLFRGGPNEAAHCTTHQGRL
jgi:hypothetical protein